MILTVTPNTAIDRTGVVSDLVLDKVLRPDSLLALPGGKGINVARAAKTLDAAVQTTGLVGGHAGRWIVEALEDEGLRPTFAEGDFESRTTYTLVLPDGHALLLYERGEEVPATLAAALIAQVERLQSEADAVVVAGTMPRGISASAVAELVAVAGRGGRTSVLDSSDAGLRAALGARPSIVKITADEGVEAGLAPPGPDAAARVVEALLDAGVDVAVATDGARAVIGGTGSARVRAVPPRVDVVSTVGSGDCFTAAFVASWLAEHDLGAALAEGCAAGAANAAMLGAGRFDVALQRRLAAEVELA